jgi:hypothetical protein
VQSRARHLPRGFRSGEPAADDVNRLLQIIF